ncbi:hypothetical protein HHI36_015368 [Cryptolaemus montrouzieri]|uniref:Uncharacterized protein n=1 Tax=Cryptolaemus montrouzieri TaxID=559131 RepID=A0ABD2N5C0_9CUCU
MTKKVTLDDVMNKLIEMDTNYNTLLSKLESLERENRALKNELKVVKNEVVIKHNKQGLNTEELFSEFNDRLYRSNNVIIYNLSESMDIYLMREFIIFPQ